MPYRADAFSNITPHDYAAVAAGNCRPAGVTLGRQRGAAIAELGLVLVPLLLLGVLIVEAAHWQIVQQLAYVALLDTARAGATQHAQPDVMARAFAHAILPRFIHAGGDARVARDRAWRRLQQTSGLPAWRIEVLPSESPSVLRTRLTYLHEPLTPLTRTLLRRFARSTDDCADRALAQGLLAIRLELHIEMHSPPIDWETAPRSRDDRVVYGMTNCGDR